MSKEKEFISRIYGKYSHQIFVFLMKYNHNSEIAEDLLQDSFISFFEKYSSSNLSDSESLKLLYRISRNNSINYKNKLSTRKEKVVSLDGYKTEKSSFVETEELRDLESRLHACLSLLPEEEKTAFLLKNVEEMKLEEISGIMNVSISTASRLVVKATSKLLGIAKEKGILV